MSNSTRLQSIAAAERFAATEFAARVLPADTRVSVYLFQPVTAPGLRAESPGALWDIGPIPPAARNTPRELLYTCAESGRTGSFLQSGDECTKRVPQTTRINADAAKSYKSYNRDSAVRRAQIVVEAARHSFDIKDPDGPPEGFHIHHLALAPGVQSFEAVSSGRIPVLGTIFALTKEKDPHTLHEYANLVDYAIFIAGEMLEIRAEHLFGRAHVAAGFEGSALEALLDSPTSDAAVQLAMKLLFAHHWFFPYDPVAWALLERALGGTNAARAAFERHEWLPPRRHLISDERTDVALRTAAISDLTTLVQHIAWYRLGTEFRPRPGGVRESVTLAVNTALLLLCGERTALPAFRLGARQGGYVRRRDESIYLGPPPALAGIGRDGEVVAPVFPLSGLQQLVRGKPANGGSGISDRFAASLGVCGPGDTSGHTRTHLKPSSFVDGFEPGGAPRISSRQRDGIRDRTRWLCSYAIGRLATIVAAERGA